MGQLHHGLVLNNLLRHRAGIRIAHRDDVGHVVVNTLGLTTASLGLVVIVIVGVVTDDTLQQLKLLAHGIVQAGLHSTHHLQHTLKNRKRRTHRGIGAHVAYVQIPSRGKRTTFLDDVLEQPIEHLARLFVRQREDVVTDAATRDVHVTEFTGSNGGIVTFNPQPA